MWCSFFFAKQHFSLYIFFYKITVHKWIAINKRVLKFNNTFAKFRLTCELIYLFQAIITTHYIPCVLECYKNIKLWNKHLSMFSKLLHSLLVVSLKVNLFFMVFLVTFYCFSFMQNNSLCVDHTPSSSTNQTVQWFNISWME